MMFLPVLLSRTLYWLTLLDSEVKSPLKVFGIQQSQAYDILPMTGATSLGIYLSQKDSIRIEVKPIQGVDMSGYVLHDMLSRLIIHSILLSLLRMPRPR